MTNDIHEVTAISDHTRCFSNSVYEIDGVGCKCKTDTVETRIVGTNDYRNWQFPKGRNPLVIGQRLTETELRGAQSLGAVMEAEKKREERRNEIITQHGGKPEKGA